MIWDKYTFLAVNEKEVQKSMLSDTEIQQDPNFEYRKKIEEEEKAQK